MHETQYFIVSAIASEVSPPGICPLIAKRNVLARPRVASRSLREALVGGVFLDPVGVVLLLPVIGLLVVDILLPIPSSVVMTLSGSLLS